MSQRQQLERIIEIDRQIRAGKYPNARRLANDLETSLRVIYNDREFMINRLGAPIAFNAQRGGWYYTNSAYALPSIMVTEGEMLALFLSVEIAQRNLGNQLEQDLRSAVGKLSSSLKGPVTIDLETLRNHYTFALPAVHVVDERLLLDLHRAIREKYKISIKYFTASRNTYTQRIIEPYHLCNIHGDWYLIAFDHMRSKIRNFQLGRVEVWNVLDEKFCPDPSFHIDEWLSQMFFTEHSDKSAQILIRFDAHQAHYIRERRWHETQQIEELENGELILHLHSGSLDEIRRWVMQYGSHAEVLQPIELRAAVIEEIERMKKIYACLASENR